MARLIVIALLATMTGAGAYASWTGVWGEDNDIQQSMRLGSRGGGYGVGIVK